MKKSALPAALLLLGVVLSGCPVYEADDDGCFTDVDCPYGYVCDGRDEVCVQEPSSSLSCDQPSDCDANETCSRFGTCSAGDCHFSSVGCVSGYECSSESGRWECVEQGSGGEGGNDSGGAPSTGGGAPSTSGGAPGAAGAPVSGGEGGTSDGGATTSAGNGGAG